MITRRATLGLLAALPATVRAASGPVAIVGAGAAGLAAAEALRRAGRAFILLEARDRIGGRAHTDRSLGAEAGSTRARNTSTGPNGTPGPPSPGRRARGSTIRTAGRAPSSSTGDRRPRRSAPAAAPASRGSMPSSPQGRGHVPRRRGEARRPRCRGGDLRLEPPVPRGGSGRVSAADYDRLWSGTDLWVDGYGDLVATHFAHLPVRLNCPVLGIDWSGAGVRLRTASGTLDAAAAIVTVPVGVLKDGGIAFTPALPSPTQAALDGLSMGAYSKVALRLDPKRIDPKAVGDAVSVARDGPTIYFEMGRSGGPWPWPTSGATCPAISAARARRPPWRWPPNGSRRSSGAMRPAR